MLLNFGVAALNPTLALPEDSVAVFLEGRRVAAALEQDANLYLPAQGFFKLVDVEPVLEDNRITADLPLRGTFTMQVGRRRAALIRGIIPPGFMRNSRRLAARA